MKRLTCFLAMVAALWVLVSPVSAAEKTIKLKAVQFISIGDPSDTAFRLLLDTINKEAKEELTIEIVGGPEAIPGLQQPDAVRTGAVDIAFVPCGWYIPILPIAAVMGLSRLEPWDARKSGLHDFLVEHHKKVGLRFIGATDFAGDFWLYAKEPIASPGGLKGKRFRHAPTYHFFPAFGIVPMTAAIPDIYSGLERNLFDGLAIKHNSFINLSLFEVCKYVVGPGFWPNFSAVTIMNEEKFKGLPNHLQKLIVDTQEKAEPLMKKAQAPIIDKHWTILKEKGVKHIEWSPGDTKFFLDKIDEVAWEILGKKLPEGTADKMKKMMGF